jgi:hypothetical protein
MSKRGSQRAIRLGGKIWSFGKTGRPKPGKGWKAIQLEKARKKSKDSRKTAPTQQKKKPVDSDFAVLLTAALGGKKAKKRR